MTSSSLKEKEEPLNSFIHYFSDLNGANTSFLSLSLLWQLQYVSLSAVHWIENWSGVKSSFLRQNNTCIGLKYEKNYQRKRAKPLESLVEGLTSQKSDGLNLASNISLCQWDNIFSFSHCHFNWAHWHPSETLISVQSINFQSNSQMTTKVLVSYL